MSLQSALMKDGTRHMMGIDEAVLRNIEAARDLAKLTRTSLGPLGMNKMVINGRQKLFVTNDASTILNEIEVFHPAAKLLIMNSKRQEAEFGDFTNFVIILAGELLGHAESLLRMGLHPNEVMKGYEKALKKVDELADSLEIAKIENILDLEQVTRFVKTSVMSKQYGYEDLIAKVVAQACTQICPKNALAFDVDNVRVVKIEGGSVSDISVVKGFILPRSSEGTIKKVENAKIAVFGGGIDFGKTESKDTFLITEASQLEGFQKEQEDHMEKIIKSIADTGVKAIVCNGSISPLAMHFLELYKLMVIKVGSKFDVTRICKATGANPAVRLAAPMEEELGFCDSISVEEIGGTNVCIFKQVNETSKISTIIIRGATENIMNDVERAVEDGINTYKALTKDGRVVAGGGSFEIDLSLKLKKEGGSISGQDQYSFKKFAEALEVVPRTLAENSGHNSTLIISNLYAQHSGEGQNTCIDVDTGDLFDAKENGFFDHLVGKKHAIKLATDAALNILKIDQILMVKSAEGPKVPPPRPMDAD